MVAFVLNKKSAIWKDAKTLLRDDQLKYIDVESMRAVTNNRCEAEQTRSDKVENVATGGIKIGDFGQVGKKMKKQHRDGWSQNWNS